MKLDVIEKVHLNDLDVFDTYKVLDTYKKLDVNKIAKVKQIQ